MLEQKCNSTKNTPKFKTTLFNENIKILQETKRYLKEVLLMKMPLFVIEFSQPKVGMGKKTTGSTVLKTAEYFK